MLLLALACATTRVATVVSMTPGGGPGEVYVLAEVRDVVGEGAPNERTVWRERVLLRCQEDALSTSYATVCHPFLTSAEAGSAAISLGDTMYNHSRKPRPPPAKAQDRHDDDE